MLADGSTVSINYLGAKSEKIYYDNDCDWG